VNIDDLYQCIVTLNDFKYVPNLFLEQLRSWKVNLDQDNLDLSSANFIEEPTTNEEAIIEL
jgi:hypothetical protein